MKINDAPVTAESLLEHCVLAASYASAAEAIRLSSGWRRYEAIRDFYEVVMPQILEESANVWAIDPYAADWVAVFTPIEFSLWCDIRGQGLVLYPQYPVGRYFADFANPKAKVVIECDGAAFHTDYARDQERDWYMEERGWTVYRIPGRMCVAPDEIEEDGKWIRNPDASGAYLRELAREHGLRRYPDTMGHAK